MIHTSTQMPRITLESCSLNSSSFFLSGLFSSSSSETALLILPISVATPVSTTMQRARPPETVVPEKTMLTLLETRMSASPSKASVCFNTVALSPVSALSSIRRVVDSNSTTRMSAGTLLR